MQRAVLQANTDVVQANCSGELSQLMVSHRGHKQTDGDDVFGQKNKAPCWTLEVDMDYMDPKGKLLKQCSKTITASIFKVRCISVL